MQTNVAAQAAQEIFNKVARSGESAEYPHWDLAACRWAARHFAGIREHQVIPEEGHPFTWDVDGIEVNLRLVPSDSNGMRVVRSD